MPRRMSVCPVAIQTLTPFGIGIIVAPEWRAQKRGVHGVIKRELRRRSAIEPVIGHMKSDGHLGRNFLKGRHGDRANVVLSAAGHNLRLILRWLRQLWRLIAAFLFNPAINNAALKSAC